MKKLLVSVVGIVCLGLGALQLTSPVAQMQADVVCAQDITVQAGDTISLIANSVYGDPLLFPAIAAATNAKAATDSSYATITDPAVVETGWKLCIPSPADAQTLLAGQGSTNPDSVSPEVDRVGFPEGYQENFSIFYEFDRPDNKTARVIYANEAAASVEPGQPFPYGSVLVMDVHRTARDDAGQVLLDENGRYVRDELFGLFVMRKAPGFGTKYGQLRNGEWEYAAYRPDGSTLVPPEATNSCAGCHVEAGMGKDWVFGTPRHFDDLPPAPAENEVSIVDYKFEPETLTVNVGEEVTWQGNDVIFHTVTAKDASFSSIVRPQGSFSFTFEEPGVYEYFCAVHPSMQGRIEVVE